MSLKTLIEELREFETALLANTIGCIDPTPSHAWYMSGAIQSQTPTLGPTVGVAVTCEIDSSTPDDPRDTGSLAGYYEQCDAMWRMGVPTVWVVKTVGSRPAHECVMGDGMAKTLYAAGCVGAVTDGGVRDIRGMLSVPFAVYSRGKTVHHTRVRMRRKDVPVEIGGITVKPGDIVHADSEGVIVLPKRCLKRLPEAATRMRAFETAAHRILRQADMKPSSKGAKVGALLKAYGFK